MTGVNRNREVEQFAVDSGLEWVSLRSTVFVTNFSATLDKPALVTHDVEKILGRPAQSFGDAVSAHHDLFTNH